MKVEVVCTNMESVQNAKNAGADRIELCSALSVGGLTPSPALIEAAKNYFMGDVFVLIRPREGNFIYSEVEFEIMLKDISTAIKHGASGIVSGVLLSSNKIDIERTKKLVDATYPLPFTFHRAFDSIADPITSLEILKNIGVKRILTSGQKPTALEGKELLKKLNHLAADEIIILAGSGITPVNVLEIVNETHVKEIHFSATLKKTSISKGEENKIDFGSYDISDLKSIQLIISELKKRTTIG